MTTKFSCLLLMLATGILKCHSVTIKDEGPLGRVFNIPKTDLLSSTQLLSDEGTRIAKDFPSKCIVKKSENQDQRDDAFFPATKNMYSDLATRAKLDPELQKDFTLKYSLNALTNSISASDGGPVTLYALRYNYHSEERSISKQCLNEIQFTKKFLDAFKALPDKIEDPKLRSSWIRYENIFKKYGTHMVKGITYGSSISQYSFAKGSNRYSEQDLKAKACGSFRKGAELEIASCDGITEEDISKANQLEISAKIVIRGGSEETRAKLLYDRSEELLKKFKSEAETSASPIEYTFVPVWELLKVKFFGTGDFAKAKLLEEFYKGFLNFGCGHLQVHQKDVQAFEMSSDSSSDDSSYQCKLRERGCVGDTGCRYVVGRCSCSGPGCIEYRKETHGDGTTRNVPYAVEKGTTASEPQGGCTFSIIPIPPNPPMGDLECKCVRESGFDVIWPEK